ncbi:MFS transporter [Xanthomonas theicola]|uniref:MFS transporter n=1 Tax=Xanthomonas theicola TaxID=56464 RepID=UPI00360A7598
MSMPPQRADAPLRRTEKVGDGIGDMGFNFYWANIFAFLPIFCTDTMGLSAAAGAMLLPTKLVDAVTDPLMRRSPTAPARTGASAGPICCSPRCRWRPAACRRTGAGRPASIEAAATNGRGDRRWPPCSPALRHCRFCHVCCACPRARGGVRWSAARTAAILTPRRVAPSRTGSASSPRAARTPH